MTERIDNDIEIIDPMKVLLMISIIEKLLLFNEIVESPVLLTDPISVMKWLTSIPIRYR